MEKDTVLIQKARLLPSWRLMISLTQCFGALALYMNRINISFAIVCMTEGPKLTNFNVTGIEADNSTQNVEADFDWNRKTRGFILSSFYIGYLMTQIPAGWLLGMQKVSPKWLIFTGGLITVVLSFLSPVAAGLHWGCLVAVQIIKGLACGVYYPCQQAIISAWAAPDERSRFSALSASGSSLGSIIGFISAGILCKEGFAGGWPSIFYVYACVGGLWLVAWFVCISDSPSNHRFVGEKEANYITSVTWEDLQGGQKNIVPWKSMLKSPPLYAIWTIDFTYHWLWYTALSLLPTFINDMYNIDLKTNGLLTSLPYLVNFFLTLFASWLADFLLRSCLPTGVVRKIMVTCQSLIPAILVIAIGFMQNQFAASMTCLIIAVGLLGFGRSGHIVNTIDLSPRFAGAITGVGNTIGTLAGILAPIVAGAMVPNGTANEWRNAFYLAAALSIFGNIIFVIFAKGEVQPWAKREENDEDAAERTKLKDLETDQL